MTKVKLLQLFHKTSTNKSLDSHVIQAMISACLEGDVRSFEQLRKTSAMTHPPGPYLVRCAVRSRKLAMVKHICKCFPPRALMRINKVDPMY